MHGLSLPEPAERTCSLGYWLAHVWPSWPGPGSQESPAISRAGGHSIGCRSIPAGPTVIDPESQRDLRAQIAERIAGDRGLLDQLRAEVRPLRPEVRRIQPRTTTAISLVGTDGGNNAIPFDPFLIQLVRVVDSSRNEYCLEAISPTTRVNEQAARQFTTNGTPRSALGELMAYLGVRDLTRLSYMIRTNERGEALSPRWVQVYRELVEWAILFQIVRTKDFGTDTVLVFDGLLRTKIFAADHFRRLLAGLQEAIEQHARRSRRKLHLVGVAKHSKVLDRYRLAMALEHVLDTPYPAYVEIPRELEEQAYIDAEFARGNDREEAGREINRFVGGKMFFVKFGSRPRDPIWPIDLFLPQRDQAPVILGCMLADALEGFPVPLYPRCLQKAHEAAALVDFDYAVLQDQIIAGIRDLLGPEAQALDVFRLRDADPAQLRYG